jgi:hypothetical protein
MAMRGIPVITAGQTHYRNRGFTSDPDSWEMYFSTCWMKNWRFGLCPINPGTG